MSAAFSELDLIVERSGAEGHRSTVRFKSADASQPVPRQSAPSEIAIDFQELQEAYLDGNMERYGNRLRDAVLPAGSARDLFAHGMGSRPLRVRLHLRAGDTRLQGLHWETMTDLSGAPLSTRSGLAFSRFLPSDQEVVLRPASDALRALVAVADPSPADRDLYGLAPIAIDRQRLDASMGNIDYDELSGEPYPVSMNRLFDALRAGEETRQGYDILYLVCHGAFVREQPYLFLALETQNEQREKALFRSGQQLAERMARQLTALPRLVVLASCSGAGYGMDDALYATGPLLAMAGVPAVMAMKGFVEISMVEALLARFFSEFQKTHEVDRAMQAARAHVQYDTAADDWWAPVLFMRLTDGRLASGEPAGDETPVKNERQSVNEGAETVYTKPDPLRMANYDRVNLYRAMNAALSMTELEELAYVLEINFEDVAGAGKSGKARELIQYCERRDMIEALLDGLNELRSERDWYVDAGVR